VRTNRSNTRQYVGIGGFVLASAMSLFLSLNTNSEVIRVMSLCLSVGWLVCALGTFIALRRRSSASKEDG
jgi:hypothetical protein